MNIRVDEGEAGVALSAVAQQGLSQVSADVVHRAALAIWYGQGTVDLASVQGAPHAGDALSLVERLSFYNLVERGRKRELLRQVGQAREKWATPCDMQAFEAAYRRFLPGLQPMQTRHFIVGDTGAESFSPVN